MIPKDIFRKMLCIYYLGLLTVTSLFAVTPPNNWQSIGIGGGGATFAPSFSPFNSNEVYASCDMSELFHSLDLGTTWTTVNFANIQGGRLAKVNFTSNPSILYNIDYSDDSQTPVKSTDGGQTWTPLSGDSTYGGAFSLFADPGTTNRVEISDYDTLYFSTDGGNTFSSKLYFPNGGNGCYVAGAFYDGNNIYFGTSSCLLVSQNNGSTFNASTATGIPSSESMISFAGAKENGTTRFYAITCPNADIYPGITIEDLFSESNPLKVYKMDWGISNWTQIQTGIDSTHRVVFVAAALNDINNAYLAGGYYNQDWPVVYKTANGGGNWQQVLLTSTNQNIYTGWEGNGGDRDWSYGGGIVGFNVAPNDSNKVAFTDYGFIHISTTGGAFWQQAYVNPLDENPPDTLIPAGKPYQGIGLENTSCWHVTWYDASNIWGCFTDIRGIRSVDAGTSWSFNYTGDSYNTSYQCIKHPTNGIIYLATSSIHDIYESTHLTDASIDGGNGAVLYSTNTGKTWQVLHNFNHPVIDLAIDPNNTNTVYASVINSTNGGIYVSYNISSGASSTWAKLPNPPRTQGHPFNVHVLNDGSVVCTYSGRYAGSTFTDSAGVFVLNSGSTTWIDRTGTYMHYWTKDLVVDPFDTTQNTWYVGVYSGWGGPYATNNLAGGLYETQNRGGTWSLLTGIYRVGSCAVNPNNSNELYLTTETNGLWYTSNLRSGTPTFSVVTGYPFRQPERVYYNPYNSNEIWVTSFGDGIRVGNTSSVFIQDWKKY